MHFRIFSNTEWNAEHFGNEFATLLDLISKCPNLRYVLRPLPANIIYSSKNGKHILFVVIDNNLVSNQVIQIQHLVHLYKLFRRFKNCRLAKLCVRASPTCVFVCFVTVCMRGCLPSVFIRFMNVCVCPYHVCLFVLWQLLSVTILCFLECSILVS